MRLHLCWPCGYVSLRYVPHERRLFWWSVSSLCSSIVAVLWLQAGAQLRASDWEAPYGQAASEVITAPVAATEERSAAATATATAVFDTCDGACMNVWPPWSILQAHSHSTCGLGERFAGQENNERIRGCGCQNRVKQQRWDEQKKHLCQNMIVATIRKRLKAIFAYALCWYANCNDDTRIEGHFTLIRHLYYDVWEKNNDTL